MHPARVSRGVGSTRSRHHAGSGTAALELAIITPVLLLLIMSVAQFATWQQGREVGEAAARRGALAARILGGTDAAGQAAAEHALAELAPSLVRDPDITITRTATFVRVDIHGAAESVIPFLSLPISVSSQQPIERATTAGMGP